MWTSVQYSNIQLGLEFFTLLTSAQGSSTHLDIFEQIVILLEQRIRQKGFIAFNQEDE